MLRTGNDESEIHEPAEDEFEIFEAVENVSDGDAAFAGGATLVLFKPGFDVGALVFLEPGIVLLVVQFSCRQGRLEEAFLYHFASSGKSGIVKYSMNETTHVSTPSDFNQPDVIGKAHTEGRYRE